MGGETDQLTVLSSALVFTFNRKRADVEDLFKVLDRVPPGSSELKGI